jgi:hypothetical protein
MAIHQHYACVVQTETHYHCAFVPRRPTQSSLYLSGHDFLDSGKQALFDKNTNEAANHAFRNDPHISLIRVFGVGGTFDCKPEKLFPNIHLGAVLALQDTERV